MQYEKVPDVESSSESLLHSVSTPDRSEQHRCIRRRPKYQRAWRLMRDEWPRSARIVVAVNVALSVLLLCLYLHALWGIHSSPFYRAPRPPYLPLLEDGVIEYENKRFHPDRIFQEGPSPLPSSEIYYAPGSYIYGVSIQAIMCNGDVQMMYWRNKTSMYVDEDTKEERYTEEYLRMDKKERAYGTALLWDEWTRKHQLRDEEYWREAPNFRRAEE
ncbi:hypothetical protein QR685DRAFT_576000 [Neurospora intermedia]|uniref:Uncharacterized protein n=1 Tax=Neurospora intermedia TaxID=5142 RepID=A0ABR3CZJ4_NEUIN